MVGRRPERGDMDEKLYMIRYDGIDYYVQGKGMMDAIAIWKEEVAQRDEEHGWDGTEEPEQVVEVHDEGVIMRTPKKAGKRT